MSGPYAQFHTAWNQYTNERYPPAWRVYVPVEDGPDVTVANVKHNPQFHFASKRDAELAVKALNDAGLDTYEKLKAVPWKVVMRTMCEVLPW